MNHLQKTKGTIFDIRRMSVHDGTGIRTTIFLKGCNMVCEWCHNPESINKDAELMFDLDKCINCMSCEKVCERGVHEFVDSMHIVYRNRCNACGRCIEVCPTKAVEICGKTMLVKEVLEIVIRDKTFYDVSNGGITISGGEPLIQKKFTLDLLCGAKSSGINTILDTNGNWNWDDVEEMLPCIDGFRYDLKTMDCDIHKFYTGVSNKLILENLKRLSKTEKDIVVTIPLIKGINDSDEDIKSTVSFLKTLSKVPKVEVLSYHSLYTSKSKKLGKSCRLFSTTEDIEKAKGILTLERDFN